MKMLIHEIESSVIAKQIDECSNDLPVVSIGSGLGTYEMHLKGITSPRKWYLVDPDPSSFQKPDGEDLSKVDIVHFDTV